MINKKPSKRNIEEYTSYVYSMARNTVSEYTLVKDNQLYGHILAYWTKGKMKTNCHVVMYIIINGKTYTEAEQTGGDGIDLLSFAIGQMLFRLTDTLKDNGFAIPDSIALYNLSNWYSNNWIQLFTNAGFSVIKTL